MKYPCKERDHRYTGCKKDCIEYNTVAIMSIIERNSNSIRVEMYSSRSDKVYKANRIRLQNRKFRGKCDQ